MNKTQYILDTLLKEDRIDKSFYNEHLSSPLSSLIDSGLLTQAELMQILSKYYITPFADIDYLPLPRDVDETFSVELMKQYSFVPIEKVGSTLIVATSNPRNVQMRSTLDMLHTGDVQYVLVDEERLENFLQSYSVSVNTQDALRNITNNVQNSKKDKENSDISLASAPSVKFVDSVIRESIPLNASDIHIEPGEESVTIRYRIDGDLIEWAHFPIESYPEICARLKILSDIDIAEKRIPQDGRISLNIGGEDINFRVSTLPTIHGEKFVIRVLDNKIFSYSLKELEFSTEAYELILKILKHPHGIILLTGPTGSGKTTTLYAFLREINDGKKNIVTIEDPVEYDMKGVNQLQVNRKAGLTFASSLRSILRQDPDIIMVGEIRDEETAQIATRSAITGHMVLSTLHTNDAVGAVIRLIDMGIPKYFATDALVGVISQRLVKKLCPHCKRPITTTPAMQAMLGIDEPAKIYEKVGCPYCNNTGYKGRCAVHEILYFDSNFKAGMQTENVNIDALRSLAIKNGMVSMRESCLRYVLSGITSIEEYSAISLGEES